MDIPVKVAVYGSCVTRDNFNRTFNPGYKDLFTCVAMGNHVSAVALMAPPVAVVPEELDNMKPPKHAELVREFARSFLDELREAQPNYLIMDFWTDVMFGFADLDGGDVVTYNIWTTVKSTFFSKREFVWHRPDRNPEEFMRRWQHSMSEFFDWIHENLPQTKIILHSARNVGQWLDRQGRVHNFEPWILQMNRYWRQMDAYVESFPNVRVIKILRPRQQQSFADHPWGRHPVHYTFDYHQRFLAKLASFAFEDFKSESAP